VLVVVGGREREAEPGVGDRVLGISAVDLIAGVACTLAKVLVFTSAELALATREGQPWDADAIAWR
jgi:hypothetical protein